MVAAMTLMWATGCVTTPGFETGRALPAGESRILIGLSVSRTEGDSSHFTDLRFDVAWVARITHGLGNGYDADATVTLPGPVCGLGACAIGIAAGLKKGEESADALAAAAKIEAGIDWSATAPPRDFSGWRLHASGRLIGSWHSSEANALYAAPYLRWDRLVESERLPEAKGGGRIVWRSSTISFGGLVGWKHVWPSDDRFATYVEADGTLTPRQAGSPAGARRISGRVGFDADAWPEKDDPRSAAAKPREAAATGSPRRK
jgi:hypothetical protein